MGRGDRQAAGNDLFARRLEKAIASGKATPRAMSELRICARLFGKPLDPWIRGKTAYRACRIFRLGGLGSNGISSSSMDRRGVRALGEHTDLGLTRARHGSDRVHHRARLHQVLELFPTGGGGYRVATRLIGPYRALLGRSADSRYVLTISISIAKRRGCVVLAVHSASSYSLRPRFVHRSRSAAQPAGMRKPHTFCCRSFSASFSRTRSSS